jgi:hypothetical protein
MGTLSEPVPVTRLVANFSPIPRMAPPPLGRDMAVWLSLPLAPVPLLGLLPSGRKEGNVPVDPDFPLPPCWLGLYKEAYPSALLLSLSKTVTDDQALKPLVEKARQSIRNRPISFP